MGDSQLMSHIKKGNKAIAEELLKSKQVNIHVKNSQGETALHLAIEQGLEEIVETLLNRGADPNSWNTLYKGTPLYAAAAFNHVVICRLLLAAGAKRDTVCIAGKTAYDIAKMHNSDSILELFNKS